MGFFEDVNVWLTALLNDYIHQYTAKMAALLEPAIVTLGTLYVLVWGYLHIAGRIQEPVLEGLKRIATLAVVFGVSLNLWLYDEVIVETFYRAPALLAGRLVGATDFVTIIDTILFQGNDVGQALLAKAGVFHGNISFYFAAIFVYFLVTVAAIYTMFLLTLSRVALSVLLAIGPLIIPLFLFSPTRRLVEAWFAQLANYAFVAILAGLVTAFMMHLISVAATQAQAQGGGIEIAHALKVCMAALFTLLVMRQVLPMASGLASGFALSSYGIVSNALEGTAIRNRQRIGEFGRGLLDGTTTRWDSPSRKAGSWLHNRLKRPRSNSIRP
jgi:type IV secretion system protein VirB6